MLFRSESGGEHVRDRSDGQQRLTLASGGGRSGASLTSHGADESSRGSGAKEAERQATSCPPVAICLTRTSPRTAGFRGQSGRSSLFPGCRLLGLSAFRQHLRLGQRTFNLHLALRTSHQSNPRTARLPLRTTLRPTPSCRLQPPSFVYRSNASPRQAFAARAPFS